MKKPMVIHYFTHLLLLSFLSLNSAICYATEFSYSEHCSSIVPESIPKKNTNLSLPLGRFHTGYGGGRAIFNQNSSSFSKSFVFRTRNSYYTSSNGVLKVEADFLFPEPYISSYGRSLTRGMGKTLIRLWLDGFWSESSGKLCMIGSSRSKDGVFPHLNAVLKLENIKNSSNVSSLISGTLECFDSSDGSSSFEPISILMLPQFNYEYTLVPKRFDAVQNLSFTSSMPGPSFCNEGWWPPNGFNLKYEGSCDSENSCIPFGVYVPPTIFISGFACSDEERRLRVVVEFFKMNSIGFYHPFYPNTTLVGEGYWSEEKLSIVACRFLNVAESLADARMADCSIRMRLSFSATLSIRETSNVVGKIWNSKTLKDPGYFDNITFYSSENRIVGVPGLKYKYTETDRVKNSCTRTLNNRERYPTGNSIHMRFDMSVNSSEGKVAWGSAIPFSVGDQFYEKHSNEELFSRLRPANSAVEAKFSSLVNMSYRIGLTMLPGANVGEGIFHLARSSFLNEVKISAEGIYNEKSGSLCMIGCRNLETENQTDNLDCEILLKFQFPPLEKEGYIKGSIESMREKSDPLYFDPLETSSAAYSIIRAKNIFWRMDMEIVIALVSSTLACVFVGLQCLHAKSQPEVLPLISAFMLSILSLGHLLPLVVNLGSLFLKNGDQPHHFLGIGGSLEANEVIVYLVQMVAFFFQFYLLQLTWIARFSDERHKGLWLSEKNTLLVSVLVYAAMVSIALLTNWGEKGLDQKTCGEVVLDGFLLPQILLNIFRDSKENVLSCSFYIGTTLIQLLPHVYNLYEAYTCALPFSLWEVIFILEGVVFAAIIYMQQRCGGGFILSQRSTGGIIRG